MSHIFISYSHTDDAYVHQLAQALEEEGFSTWVDDRIDYGTTWTGEVQKRLDTCAAFILVMTPKSFESRWVNNELSRAMRKNKPIYPLLLEGDEPWLAVESIQFLDVRGGKLPDERFYQQLSMVVPRRKPVEEAKLETSQPQVPVEKAPEKETPPQQITVEKAPEKEPAPQQIAVEKAAEKEIPPEQIPVEKVPEKETPPQQVPVVKIPERETLPQKVKQEKKAEPKPAKEKKPAGQPRPGRRKWVIGSVIGGVIVLCLAVVGTCLWLFRGPLHLVASPTGTRSSPGGTPSWFQTPLPTLAAGTAAPVLTGPISVENAEWVTELERWGGLGMISQMVLNSPGDTLAVATSQGVYLLDPVTLEVETSFEYDYDVTAIAFTKDGKTLAVGLENNSIQVITLAGSEVYKFETTAAVNSLAFDSYGTMLAAGLDNGVFMVWSMADGSPIYSSEATGAAISAVLFNWGDNLLVTGATNGEIYLWQLPEGTPVLGLELQDTAVTSLAISPDGSKLAAGGWDGTIWGFSLPYDRQLYHFDGLTHHIPCLAYSWDNWVLASGTENGKIYLWKPEEETAPVVTLEGHSAQVRSVAFTPDGSSLISGSLDGTVRLWDLTSLTEKTRQDQFSMSIWHTALSPDGKILAQAMQDGSVQLWDIGAGTLSKVLEGLLDSYAIGFSPDGETIFSVSSLGIGKWQIAGGNVGMLVDDFPAEVTSAAFDPVSQQFAVGFADDDIGYYSSDGTLLHKWGTDAGDVPLLLEYSPDGKLLAASYNDGLLVVWQEGEPYKLHFLPDAGVMKAITFTVDSETLLMAGDDGSLRSLSMESGEVHDLSSPELRGAILMEFSPDGKVFALGLSDYSLVLVDYDKTQILQVLEGHTHYATSLTFLLDASKLISTSLDGTTIFWGVAP